MQTLMVPHYLVTAPDWLHVNQVTGADSCQHSLTQTGNIHILKGSKMCFHKCHNVLILRTLYVFFRL